LPTVRDWLRTYLSLAPGCFAVEAPDLGSPAAGWQSSASELPRNATHEWRCWPMGRDNVGAGPHPSGFHGARMAAVGLDDGMPLTNRA
jgi:hypothetical protein